MLIIIVVDVVVILVVVIVSIYCCCCSYGREDEEVMGLRFCNEAIMSLHQIWPRLEEPSRESLSPLQVSSSINIISINIIAIILIEIMQSVKRVLHP